MYPSKTSLLIAILVMSITSIVLEAIAPLWAYGITKGLTTVLVLLLASSNKQISRLGTQLITALLFCLLGDIALLWEGGFLLGLGFFLIAHLLFIRAFRAGFGMKFHWMAIFITGVLTISGLYFIWPKISGILKIAILSYVLVIGIMSSLSMSIAIHRQSKMGFQLGVGGLFFMISDTILGINAFVSPVPFASIFILTSYWGAITSLAIAARGF
jgi:uncharacterized membrane protein YhhN